MRELIRRCACKTRTAVTTWGDGIPSPGVIFLTALLLAATESAVGSDVQPLDSIRDAARAYAEEHLLPDGLRGEVRIGRLDPRLRLRACDAPLQAFQQHGARSGSRQTVGIRCRGSAPWTIYVSADIDSYAEVYRLRRGLRRGERLGEQDVELVEMNIGNLGQGYITDPAMLMGMELRRPGRAGEVLTPTMLAPPELVRRGQTVVVFAGTGSTQVSMQGEALDSGALGDRIRVRNGRSQRIVEGAVVGENRVEVPM